jgi:peptide/nickel transport system permease protein
VRRQGSWTDHWITALSAISMSLSFLVIIIVLQVLLSTPIGLNLFPVRGWQISGPLSYAQYVAVPTLALILVSLGYNARFYRAVFVEEHGRDHVRALRAFGTPEPVILWRHVLRNSLVPLITRLVFSIPLIVISGSLLMETYFGIPGIGRATFEAISNGDQPVLKAVVGLSAVAFVLLQFLADLLCRLVDPRVAS